METIHTQNKTRRILAITGLLYLGVIILAGFSQGYARGTLVNYESAAITATQILQNTGLFRLGLAADLVAFLLDAIISILLYIIFKPISKNIALIASSLRLLAHPAIATANLVHHYLALDVLVNPEIVKEFSVAQAQAMSLFFMEAHRVGYLLAGVFFGLHCFLLGWLIAKHKQIPTIFGVFMVAAAGGYLLESFGDFLFPGNETVLATIVGVSAALGEVSLTFYFIIKNFKFLNYKTR